MSIETFEQYIKRIKNEVAIKENETSKNEVSECEIEIQLKDSNKVLRDLLNYLIGFKGNVQLTKLDGEIKIFDLTELNEITNLVIKDYNRIEVVKDELITDDSISNEIDTEIEVEVENEQEE